MNISNIFVTKNVSIVLIRQGSNSAIDSFDKSNLK